MLFTIILFFLALAVGFAIISRKVWQFRTGKILPGSYEEADWHELSVESVRLHLVEVAKFSVHHFVLFMLKVWIIISSMIRRTDARIKNKLTRVIHKNGHLEGGGNPSSFLRNVRKHKDAVASSIEKEGSE